MTKVVDLDAHVPQEVRALAKAAYAARQRKQRAMAEHGAAMRAFSDACKKFAIDPAKLQVGELCGSSLVPAPMRDD